MSITFAPTTHGGPAVNLNNRNAQQVLDLLGYDEDWWEDTAEAFLGRVLIAQALIDTTGVDEDLPTNPDGRWIECGRPAGHLTGRLAELHEVATWALRKGCEVAWG